MGFSHALETWNPFRHNPVGFKLGKQKVTGVQVRKRGGKKVEAVTISLNLFRDEINLDSDNQITLIFWIKETNHNF